MRRRHWIAIVAALALLVALFAALGARAQDDVADCIELFVNGDLVYESAACDAGPTPTPEPTATPTPEPVEHDTETWHPPEDHHHGADPDSAHPAIVAFLDANPVYKQIGNAWLTSPTENVYPYPDGKHVGFANLAEFDTGCQTSPRGGSDGNCVAAYYLQVHSLGTADALRTRSHSDKLVALVCDEIGGQCDVVATGGHAGYGTMQSQYKEEICPDPNNPDLPEKYQLDQPPYRTVNLSDRSAFLWSSNINALVESYIDPDPNQVLQVVWSERPWTVPARGDACLDPAQDVTTGHRGNEYQVFSIYLDISDFPRPFDGFTDIHGVLRDDCTEAGPDCVPLYIGPDVPSGDFRLLRSVRIGDPEAAPILRFDGPDLVQPGG